jgi:predicted unusual protein kinase regulating ubiquinone biosynthesis (AarF/ABC1/UbiB family)
VKQYRKAVHRSIYKFDELHNKITIEIQKRVVEKYGNLKKFENLKDLLEAILVNYPIKGAFQDELIAYCWALYDHFTDHRHKKQLEVASQYILSLMSGTGWGSIGRDKTALDTLHYFRDEESFSDDYLEHIIGYKFFSQEIYETVGTRRFAFESALEYPFTDGTAAAKNRERHSSTSIPPISCGFAEFFIGKRLYTHDSQIVQLLKTDFRAAIQYIRNLTKNLQVAPVEVYIEYIIRTTLKENNLSLVDILYLYEQFDLLSEKTRKNSYLEIVLLRMRIDKDPHFFEDYEKALALVLGRIPKGNFDRNEFIEEIQKKCNVTPEEVKVLESHIVDETGIEKDRQRERARVTLFDLVGQLEPEQKGQLLFYLIDKGSPKPTGKVFSDFESRMKGDLSNTRTLFQGASNSERKQLIQRLVFGPEAVLTIPHAANGNTKHESVTDDMNASRQSFASRMAEIFINKSEITQSQNTQNYQELLSAAIVSMDPLKASSVISSIVNKIIELDRLGEKLSVEDMLYIAVLSFGSVGIKASQLIADYPWVPEEIKAVFSQGLWNAEVVKPADLLKVFEYEKEQLGNFEGITIKRFIKPLGSAGICQAYLVEIEFINEQGNVENKTVVFKAVKPGVIGMRQIARDIKDLKNFLSELKNRGYDLDVPANLTDIITTIILEERNKKNEAAYFADYQQIAEERSINFDTPDVIAVGQFSIFVEFIEGSVLAESDPEDGDIFNIIMAAFQDLQIGLINLDDHLGNFIKEKKVTSIDGGFTIDLRKKPELHKAVLHLVMSVLSGNVTNLTEALLALGIPVNIATLDMKSATIEKRIEIFRNLFFSAPESENAIVLHKMLWWMYRKLTLYHKSSPYIQSFIAGTLNGSAK